MSDINLDFTVSNNEITFTVEPNEITFTPSDIQLTINPAFTPVAGGVDGDVQFNSGGNLVGYPTFKFYYLTNTLSVTNLIANASNFTSNIGNIHITGGNPGYVLATDGLANLYWSATGGGGGNGSPGGANTYIQFNDSGLFGGVIGFTFDKISNTLTVAGTANISNTIINANGINTPGYYGNITGANVISTNTLTANGNITSLNANLGNLVTANFFAGTLITNAQPNITSVGTLTGLQSTGNVTTTATFGYNAGAGGTVTQLTSRTTPVTLNKYTGQITLFSANLTANTQQQFVLNNSLISNTDMVLVQHISGGTLGLYNVTATPNNGNATISIRNNSAAASGTQTPVLQFAVIKSVIT